MPLASSAHPTLVDRPVPSQGKLYLSPNPNMHSKSKYYGSPPPQADRVAAARNAAADVFDVASLRDRVMRRLLDEGRTDEHRVATTWQRWKMRQRSGEKEALWRVYANTPGIDSAMVYEMAARVYAFSPIDIAVMRSLVLIQSLDRLLTDDQWTALIELGLLPVSERGVDPTTQKRLTFATFDPTYLASHRLIRSLNLGAFEIRYAPKPVIQALMAEAFPRKQFLMRDASRRFLHNTPQNEHMSHLNSASGERSQPY